MRRVCGFGMFCFALGMLVMMILPNEVIGFLLICICLALGYNLFCCK